MEGRGEQELAAVLGIGRMGESKQVDPSLEEIAEDMNEMGHFPHLEVKQKHRKNIKIRTNKKIRARKRKKIKTILDESIHNEILDDCKLEKVTEYECTICEVTFNTRLLLKYHKNSKHKRTLNGKTERALCNICSTTFSSKYILESHVKTRHEVKTESDTLKCDICPKTFSTKYRAKYHMRTHDAGSEEKVICNICSKTLSNLYNLKYHMLTHDPNYKIDRALCSECSRTFSSKIGLKKHIMSEHEDQKYTPCSICGLAFTIFSISKHVRLCKLPENERKKIREKNKVECNACGKILADKVKLKRHIRFIHNQEKLFQCNFCDHKDFRTDNIKVHIQNNHNGKPSYESFSRITPLFEVI